MKKTLYYGLSIVVVIFLMKYNFGLFQSDVVSIDDIKITVPLGSVYSSTYSQDNDSYASLYNAAVGNYKDYSMKDGEILTLRFNNRLLFKETVITFIYETTVEEDNVEKKCTENKSVPYKNKYETGILFYKNYLLFNIITDKQEDIDYFYKQICD